MLALGDDPANPTAGVAKDVWALGVPVRPMPSRVLPQVDFGASVPTRVADSLHWMNRAAERAETIARVLRAVAASFDEDPGLMHADAERRPECAAAMLRALSAPNASAATTDIDGGISDYSTAVDAATVELSRQIGAVLSEAITVREYLSATAGRLLSHLAQVRSSLVTTRLDVDRLDGLLVDFAALGGLWNESTVRGPAWRIGDLGRRLERGSLSYRLVSAGLTPGAGEPLVAGSPAAWAAELTLAGCESLVAYRRRHRSDVERRAAVALLVDDAANPRSIRASLASVARHADAINWDDGRELLAEVGATIDLASLSGMLQALDTSVVSRWFSAPTDPVPMSGVGR